MDIAQIISKHIKTNIYLALSECWVSNKYGNLFFPLDDKYYRDFKYIFLWGHDSLDWLTKFRPKETSSIKLVVSGFPKSKSLRDIRVSNKENSSKLNIGLVGRFSLLNDQFLRSPAQALLETGSDYDHCFPRALAEAKLLNLYMQIKKNNKFSQYTFSFRPHPTEKVDTYTNYFDKVSFKEDICEWLRSLDCVIGPASSVIYECNAAGIPYFCTDTITDCKDDTVKAEPILDRFYKIANNPETIDDLLDQLSNLNNLTRPKNKMENSYSLGSLIEYNENSINEIADCCLNDFSREKDYFFPLKSTFLKMIDTLYIIYHHLFRPHRLWLDFSFLHHSKYIK
ncbi:hypothetical protein CL656_06895 [bacterium]|nr:hypothetical protein [bacterium]